MTPDTLPEVRDYDDIEVEALTSAAKVTRAIASGGGDGRAAVPLVRTAPALYAPIDPVATG